MRTDANTFKMRRNKVAIDRDCVNWACYQGYNGIDSDIQILYDESRMGMGMRT
jgi:hypothetical protein